MSKKINKEWQKILVDYFDNNMSELARQVEMSTAMVSRMVNEDRPVSKRMQNFLNERNIDFDITLLSAKLPDNVYQKTKKIWKNNEKFRKELIKLVEAYNGESI
jgi:GTP-binding protein EngB required for normal cell division